MAIVPLTGLIRERVGKGAARQARRDGFIPAVIYGHGEAATAVSVDTREFENALRKHSGGNIIISLKLNDTEKTALIREAQRDPITHEIIHLDFQEVSMTETVRVEVNVHLIGIPKGVKDGGGILGHITRQVEVECVATAIPSSIDVDVTELNIGDSVHVRDLTIEKGEILTEPDATIATVVPPTVYEAPTETDEEAVAPEDGEPEVIAKGKDEDKDKDGAGEGDEGGDNKKEKEKK